MTKTSFFAPLAAVALVAAGAVPAFAKSQNDQANSSAASTGEKGERKICKRFTRSETRVGSEKVCLTKAQWQKFDAAQ